MTAVGLVADIGGTNARFALAGPELPGARAADSFVCMRTLKCTDHAGFVDAAQAYLASIKIDARPRAAVIAIAGPADRNVIDPTNHMWSDAVEDVRHALGLDMFILLNDWEAVAHAVPVLPAHAFARVGESRPSAGTPRHRVLAVTGPGTGLGAATLVISNDGTETAPVVIATEAGHAGFSPQTDRQREIMRFLRHEHDRVSLERILSGPGLVNLYRAMSASNGVDAPDLKPADITRLARAGETLACDTIDEFMAIFGSYCGDLALMTGARSGVMIGGGILPPLLETLRAGRFRDSFEDKGRFEDYMREIPTQVIMADEPGLAGAAVVLERLLSR